MNDDVGIHAARAPRAHSVACRAGAHVDSVCYDLMNGGHRYSRLGKNWAENTSPHFWVVCLVLGDSGRNLYRTSGSPFLVNE